MECRCVGLVRGASCARWPEQSTVFYLYTAVEDYILSAWVNYALRHKPLHLSCHYDGIRVHLPEGVTAEEFATRCEKHMSVRALILAL